MSRKRFNNTEVLGSGSNFGPSRLDGVRNCFAMMFCSVPAYLNQKAVWPLSYNKSESSEVRNQHYKATAIWSGVASFLAIAITAGVMYDHDAESAWYNGLDEGFHRLAAVATFVAIDMAISGVVAGAYAGINKMVQNRWPSNAGVVQTGRGQTEHELGEGTGLLNSVTGRQYGCHPVQAVYPMTTKKAFGLTMGVAGFATLMTLLVNPDYFNAIADSDFAHVGAVITTGLTAAVGVSLLMTGLHRAGAAIHDCKDPAGRAYQNIDSQTYAAVADSRGQEGYTGGSFPEQQRQQEEYQSHGLTHGSSSDEV